MRALHKVIVFCAIVGMSLIAAPNSYAESEDKTFPKTSQTKAETEVQNTLDILLSSIEADDYATFSLAVDDDMKSAITKEVFADVVKQIAPRLKAGHTTTYFGSMKKAGFDVHFWKLEFNDKGDHVLAELSIKEKKVGGFFLR